METRHIVPQRDDFSSLLKMTWIHCHGGRKCKTIASLTLRWKSQIIICTQWQWQNILLRYSGYPGRDEPGIRCRCRFRWMVEWRYRQGYWSITPYKRTRHRYSGISFIFYRNVASIVDNKVHVTHHSKRKKSSMTLLINTTKRIPISHGQSNQACSSQNATLMRLWKTPKII